MSLASKCQNLVLLLLVKNWLEKYAEKFYFRLAHCFYREEHKDPRKTKLSPIRRERRKLKSKEEIDRGLEEGNGFNG